MNSNEIKVNIAELTTQISRMETLRTRLIAEQLNFEFGESRGDAVTSLQDTAAAFNELNLSLQNLLQRTIDRLTISLDTMIETDNTMADALH